MTRGTVARGSLGSTQLRVLEAVVERVLKLAEEAHAQDRLLNPRVILDVMK
jgi:hypothetical protein